MSKCSYCGEGKDPVKETPTHWQCGDCEQWNEGAPDGLGLTELVDGFASTIGVLLTQSFVRHCMKAINHEDPDALHWMFHYDALEPMERCFITYCRAVKKRKERSKNEQGEGQ